MMMVKKILLMTMAANTDRDVQRFSAGTEMVALAVMMTEGSIDGRADIPSTGCHPFPDCCVNTI
jgi:hypothetical protein